LRDGSLDVVGTGFLAAAHVTPESLASIRGADRLFYLVCDPVTAEWLGEQNPAAESLSDAYVVGRPRIETYAEIGERILAPVRRGRRVCAVFYGHPGVFVHPSHAAIEQARREGFPARMFPGISAEDCLFADLELDPLARGCQSFEATHFLWRLRFDSGIPLILWQAGIVGVTTTLGADRGSPEGLRRLAAALLVHYPPTHRVIAYEAPLFGVFQPRVEEIPLAGLPEIEARVATTLYVPPLHESAPVVPEAKPAGPLRLAVVGTGYGDGQLTPEARTCLERAREVWVCDEQAARQLRDAFPRAHVVGDGATAEILAALRRGGIVCAAFSGHPCYGAPALSGLLAEARAEGFAARVFPGISAEDCLFAALGVDPGKTGRMLFSVDGFPGACRSFEPSAPLVLLGDAAGSNGLADAIRRSLPGRDAITPFQPPGGPAALYVPPA
jgi:precorrin-3B methylase